MATPDTAALSKLLTSAEAKSKILEARVAAMAKSVEDLRLAQAKAGDGSAAAKADAAMKALAARLDKVEAAVTALDASKKDKATADQEQKKQAEQFAKQVQDQVKSMNIDAKLELLEAQVKNAIAMAKK